VSSENFTKFFNLGRNIELPAYGYVTGNSYLAPLLVEKNPDLKVIAFDLPGNGRYDGLAAGGPFSLTADTVAETAF
ncbi:hypothetical protein THRCLA_21348, partial [Thraustotheca clavata]